jgi:hypothetical protein
MVVLEVMIIAIQIGLESGIRSLVCADLGSTEASMPPALPLPAHPARNAETG